MPLSDSREVQKGLRQDLVLPTRKLHVGDTVYLHEFWFQEAIQIVIPGGLFIPASEGRTNNMVTIQGGNVVKVGFASSITRALLMPRQ